MTQSDVYFRTISLALRWGVVGGGVGVSETRVA